MKLRAAPSKCDLVSQGHLPWLMLAYMLQLSPDVERVRQLVRKRLMDPKRVEQAEKHLHQMLGTLHAAGVLKLEPEHPPPVTDDPPDAGQAAPAVTPAPAAQKPSAFARLMIEAAQVRRTRRRGRGIRASDRR